MTLSEAIEILTEMAGGATMLGEDEDTKALKLGIEALKRLQDARFDQRIPYTRPLTGETEDEIKIVSDQPGESHIYQKGG